MRSSLVAPVVLVAGLLSLAVACAVTPARVPSLTAPDPRAAPVGAPLELASSGPPSTAFVPARGASGRDADEDGTPDSADRCPDAPEDRDGFQDEDGCPDPDNDQDGIPDVDDMCPNEPEDRDGWLDADGCPDPDNDKDGVPDIEDHCPIEPGPRGNRGCPSQSRPAAP
ncbi:MAG: thrombospondin type 3 repeat-containing protein [Myxococcales bacterium]|nr:thrombospondin type 3 repeat-containing protein [Myxococcales bacterium]MBL0194755.1 thrombospondin type 3 repeat-containing protein [Myxococcales bacterium]HQY62222.1 thrombospondin type 3 repeat-containing protein [Polyangiaceae bacterium]